MKKIIFLFVSFILLNFTTVYANSLYSDVSESEWYYTYVNDLSEKGIVNGDNGLFRPNDKTTYSEASKLILLATGITPLQPLNEHWASGYIKRSQELMVYPEDVNPDEYIKRDVVAVLSSVALGLEENASNFFEDTTNAKINALSEAGIITGSVENGKLVFKPDNYITRAEICAIIWRIKNYITSSSDVLEEPYITEVYMNKDAIVSLTFDDGKLDAAKFYNSVMSENNLKGTEMMISSKLSSGDISAWNEILNEGYIDIGNHSQSHQLKYKSNADKITTKQLEDDITSSYKTLCELFPEQKILTFAAPYGQTSEAATTEMKKHHFANRTTGGTYNSIENPSMMNLKSYVVVFEDDAQKLNSYIDKAIAEKKWCVGLFHGAVDTDSENPGTYDIKKDVCKAHFEYIASKSDKIWSASLTEAVQYITERKNATISYSFLSEDDIITLGVSDTLDNEIFDFPLTVKLQIPSDWTVAYNDNQRLEIIKESSKNYVYLNIVPDSGAVTITN